MGHTVVLFPAVGAPLRRTGPDSRTEPHWSVLMGPSLPAFDLDRVQTRSAKVPRR